MLIRNNKIKPLNTSIFTKKNTARKYQPYSITKRERVHFLRLYEPYIKLDAPEVIVAGANMTLKYVERGKYDYPILCVRVGNLRAKMRK